MPYPFLSDEWIGAARELRSEFPDPVTPASQPVRINLVVLEVPFGSGEVEAHLDTSSGRLDLDTGHVDGHDLKVTVDYATAKSIIVDGNPQAAMQAFITGRIQVEGDMSKLLALQSAPPDPKAQELATRLKEMTSN
jgi:hypothetical protein